MRYGSTVSCDKILSVKHSLFLKSGNTRSIEMCVMDFVSHRGTTLILIGRSAIQRVCLFGVYLVVSLKSPLLKKFVSDLNSYKAVMSWS